MSVSNQEDVILKGTKPSIAFKFSDGEREGEIPRDSLLKVLSQGEKRALYILNILFEIQSRQKQGGLTILLVDDIVDLFNYKNKYAIIEYLKDISNSGDFYCIFLSHNFDFYRRISGQPNLKKECKLMAAKSGPKLTLSQEKYQNIYLCSGGIICMNHLTVFRKYRSFRILLNIAVILFPYIIEEIVLSS